jgi:molybdopterin-containing oxidoreductase family membrane subunit
MKTLRILTGFLKDSARLIARGNRWYYAWMAFLLLLILVGAAAYSGQLRDGLIVTRMRDQVSWGFYIGNFTFLVGIAAAAIMLVIPAYIYDWEPIKEITILGEMLAISALVMCLGFVLVDIGRPDRFWHIIPLVGKLNWPPSLLAWDVIVLNLYLLLNWFVVTYLLYCAYTGRHYIKALVLPLVLLSIPMAVSIHTVTAYLYNGLAARPFWNSAILAPKFLASAFCSADPAQDHQAADHRRGHLQDRRADGLHHGLQPVPHRRRGVQGVLLLHRAPGVHPVPVLRLQGP